MLTRRTLFLFCSITSGLVTMTTMAATLGTLSTRSNYTAFIGDLSVSYLYPPDINLPNATIELISLKDGKVVLETPLPEEINEGEISVDCGSIDFAGQFQFRMLDQPHGSVIAKSNVTYVSWPKVTMSWPKSRKPLSGDVKIFLTMDRTSCEPLGNASYHLQINYLGQNFTNTWKDLAPVVVHDRHIRSIRDFEEVNEIQIPCNVFDRAGVYKAVLWSTVDPGNPLAVSGKMTLQWEDTYTVKLNRSVVFPCDGHGINVYYTSSSCPNNTDRIRTYRIMGPANALNFTSEKKPKSGSVYFPCSTFHPTVIGYCFRYVSMTSQGAVVEHQPACLPTTEDSGGTWSEWSEWSRCTGNCGSSEQRNRRRECVIRQRAASSLPVPSSSNHDRAAVVCSVPGYDVEKSACPSVKCNDVSSVTRLPTPSPGCKCGCRMEEPEGQIIMLQGCKAYSIVWVIIAPEDRVIRLTFDLFNLDSGGQIAVRDGDSIDGDLLLGSLKIDPKPSIVTSKSNVMRVEYMRSYGTNDFHKQGSGFIASYVTIPNNVTSGLVGPTGRGYPIGRQSIWESTVTVVGIALCVVIVIVSVAFVCHHHIARKRYRANMVKNTPAHQALLAHAAGPANNTSSVDGSFAEPVRDANGKIKSKSHSSKDGTPHGSRHPSMTEPSPHLGFAARASRTAGVSATPDSQRKISGGHRSVSGPSPVVSHRSMGSPHSTKMPFYKTGLSIHKGDFDEEQTSHKHGSKRSGRAAEAIPMDSYLHRNREGKPRRVEAVDDLYTPVGKRPPVEGRDSLTGGEKLDDAYKDLSDVTSKDIQQAAKFIPPTKLPIAEVRDLRSTRPQNLPCQDGDQQYNHQATSPLSRASTDLSLSLGKLRLTPGDERSPSDFITNDDFEYDDYVPQLPGSYFTMDPQAYTLTWSQQQPWGADKLKPVPSQDHDHAFY